MSATNRIIRFQLDGCTKEALMKELENAMIMIDTDRMITEAEVMISQYVDEEEQ